MIASEINCVHDIICHISLEAALGKKKKIDVSLQCWNIRTHANPAQDFMEIMQYAQKKAKSYFMLHIKNVLIGYWTGAMKPELFADEDRFGLP